MVDAFPPYVMGFEQYSGISRREYIHTYIMDYSERRIRIYRLK